MCELCHQHPATVPDRNRMGRPIKRVCSGCHSERLRADAKRVIDYYEQLKRDSPQCK
jgi:predicted CXXCH cytochrome family protein